MGTAAGFRKSSLERRGDSVVFLLSLSTKGSLTDRILVEHAFVPSFVKENFRNGMSSPKN